MHGDCQNRKERQRPPINRQRRRVIERDDPRVLIVLAMVNLNPHISVRQIERQSGIPKSTIQRIIALHGFHPYHITQGLVPNDFQRRLAFCNWAQTMIRHDFFRYIIFSDEATFHNNGQLNRHNSRYWSIENPHWYREVDHQHRWNLVVRCRVVNSYLIGPYFFEGNVNTTDYLHFLRHANSFREC